MVPERESPFTFIIRLWREKNNGAYTWRGSVECVQSGERMYFQELEQLEELLARTLNGAGTESETDGQIMHP